MFHISYMMILLPGLALDWTADDDFRVWTFTLRDQVFFHNGSPFTADDVVFTWEWARENAANATVKKFYAGTVEKVEALDDRHVKITLSAGNVDSAYLCTAEYLSVLSRDSSDYSSVERIGRNNIGIPGKLNQACAVFCNFYAHIIVLCGPGYGFLIFLYAGYSCFSKRLAKSSDFLLNSVDHDTLSRRDGTTAYDYCTDSIPRMAEDMEGENGKNYQQIAGKIGISEAFISGKMIL